MPTLNEKMVENKIKSEANYYYNKYEPWMESLAKDSPLARTRKVRDYDFRALGMQIEMFEQYLEFMKESGSIADLGKVPNIAYDLVTATYGASILPVIASVQPIEEQTGNVYFKQTKADMTRGNVNAGDIFGNAYAAPTVYQVGYAGENIEDLAFGAPTNGVLTAFGPQTLDANTPIRIIRQRSITIAVKLISTGAVVASGIDDGNGNIFGAGIIGTVNYDTTVVSLTSVLDPTTQLAYVTGYQIYISWGTDFEGTGNIPTMSYTTTSKQIAAQIFVLATDMGIFKAFALNKRFGKVAEEETLNDLTQETTAELSYTIIKKYYAAAAATNTVTWVRTPVSGVSWYDHMKELLYVISQAEGKIVNVSGRGIVNTLICGTGFCAILDGMPGYRKSGISYLGPHVHGTLNDTITVIRAPNINEFEAIALYKGNGYFDTPGVYAPYMPLFLTSSLPVPNNSLQNRSLAAVWAGLDVVIPNFLCRIITTP